MSRISLHEHDFQPNHGDAATEDLLKGSQERTRQTEPATKTHVGSDISLSWVQRRRQTANRFLIFEFLSLIINLASLVAITIILKHYDGKPSPEWPLHVTLNTLLAVVTIILKGTLIYPIAEGLSQLKWTWFIKARPLADFGAYENASRGPWGALLFFFRKRVDIVAALGALVILATLAVDPLTQQIINYRSCTQTANSTAATIARLDSVGDPGGDLGLRLMSDMVSFRTDSVHSVAPDCPSGSCSFQGPDGYYQSIAMTHTCQDTSRMIVQHPVRENDNYTLYLSQDRLVLPPLGLEQFVMLNYTYNIYGERNGSDFAVLQFLISSRPLPIFPDKQSITPVKDITQYAMSMNCSLGFEVQSINAESQTGDFQQTVVTSSPLGVPNDTTVLHLVPDDGVDLQTAVGDRKANWEALQYAIMADRVLQNGQWMTCSTSPKLTTDHTVGIAIVPTAIGVLTDELLFDHLVFYQAQCAQFIDEVGLDNFQNAIIDVFGGSAEHALGGVWVPSNGTWNAESGAGNMQIRSLYGRNSPPLTFADIDAYAKRIADSLTAGALKGVAATATNNIPAQGVSYYTTTCAHVRWQWLALPAALTLLTILFVILALLSVVRHKKHPDWPGLVKSSPLALLFFGPVEEPKYSGKLDSVTMEEVAAGVTTTLRRRKPLDGKQDEMYYQGSVWT